MQIGFKQIMSNVKSRGNEGPISHELFNLYSECLDEVTSLFQMYGEASDARMCEIIRQKKPQWTQFDEDFVDYYVVHRRRCIFLTNANWIQNEKQKRIDAENLKVQEAAAKEAAKTARQEAKRMREEESEARRQRLRQEKLNKQEREQWFIANNFQGARVADCKAIIAKLLAQVHELGGIPVGRITTNEQDSLSNSGADEDESDSDVDSNVDDNENDDDEIIKFPPRRDEIVDDFKSFALNARSARAIHYSAYCTGERCIDKADGTKLDEASWKRCLQSNHHFHLCKDCWMNRVECVPCSM
jgi:hypothetical protein